MLRLLTEPARTGPLPCDRPSLRAELRAGRRLVLGLPERRVRRRTAARPPPSPPRRPASTRPSQRRAAGLDPATPPIAPWRHDNKGREVASLGQHSGGAAR